MSMRQTAVHMRSIPLALITTALSACAHFEPISQERYDQIQETAERLKAQQLYKEQMKHYKRKDK